jgi:hypothetical protein
MSKESLRPGDYKSGGEGIQRMFTGFATDRARIRARNALREVACPAVQSGIDLGAANRATPSEDTRGAYPNIGSGQRYRNY